MLPFITSIAVPTLVFVLMLIVGFELTVGDFRRVALYPWTVAVAILGHSLLLPLLSIAIVTACSPSAPVAAALLLLAVSPGGALSNLYTQLAGRNVALSITLTSVNTLTSLLSIPFLAGPLIAWAGMPDGVGPIPADRVLLQLSLFVIAPAAIGMWVRQRHGEAIRPWQRSLRSASFVMLAILLLVSIYDVAVPVKERPVVVIETAVRNIPVSILIGSYFASYAGFAGFLASYLLVEIAMLVPYASWVRRLQNSRS